MSAKVRCRGHVVDAEGRPVEGAIVTVSNSVPEMALLSGSAGTFEVSLEPHRYRFVAIGPGERRVEMDAEVSDDCDIVLRLPR